MKQTAIFFTLCAVFALATFSASSHVRSTTSATDGTPIAWNLSNPATPSIVSSGRITYNIHTAGSDNVAFTEVEKAINASFKTWEDIPTSAIAFTQGPATAVHSPVSDGVFPIYWVESNSDPDYTSISSALAVAFTFRFTSGPRTGEITDANIVFNGVDNTWATDGGSGAFDIAEVATHEIGHALGLSHSPIASATMFPRTGAGVIKSRTISPDDQIAISAIYPTTGFLTTAAGTIRGKVSDGTNNIFGAHVVAVDANGNDVASALSQPDGNYSIMGLPPGNYTVFAMPLDPAGGVYFTSSNIGSFYNGIHTDFRTSADQAAVVTVGAETVINFTVTRMAPTMQLRLIRAAGTSSFRSSGTTVTQGQTGVTIGVSGSNLPSSGTPLSISGSGITILSTSFGTLSNGDPIVGATIDVAANAAPGGRNLIITLPGGERSILPGAIEVLRSGLTASVSAASFAQNTLASESLVSVFGVGLANFTQAATSLPLPTSLADTSVRVNGVLAPLLFVSGGQINYQIPAGTVAGIATVEIINSRSGVTFTETVEITPVAPGLFAANNNGQGVAAAIIQRRPASGPDVFEGIVQHDGTKFVTRPIDLGPATDQVFLQLFGTGLRSRSSLANVSVRIGSTAVTVLYAGPQPDFAALDQINVVLPRSLIGSGEVDLVVTIDGRTANTVRINIL
jgi:uncharacterized protein (TIGR03437 family)